MSAFKVPASKADDPANRFEFTLPESDRVWSVPLLKYMPLGMAEKAGRGDEVGALLAGFGDEDSELGVAVRRLDPEQVQALLAAWKDASGVGMGESSASSDS